MDQDYYEAPPFPPLFQPNPPYFLKSGMLANGGTGEVPISPRLYASSFYTHTIHSPDAASTVPNTED